MLSVTNRGKWAHPGRRILSAYLQHQVGTTTAAPLFSFSRDRTLIQPLINCAGGFFSCPYHHWFHVFACSEHPSVSTKSQIHTGVPCTPISVPAPLCPHLWHKNLLDFGMCVLPQLRKDTSALIKRHLGGRVLQILDNFSPQSIGSCVPMSLHVCLSRLAYSLSFFCKIFLTQ